LGYKGSKPFAGKDMKPQSPQRRKRAKEIGIME
jgi:hypothetical protein